MGRRITRQPCTAQRYDGSWVCPLESSHDPADRRDLGRKHLHIDGMIGATRCCGAKTTPHLFTCGSRKQCVKFSARGQIMQFVDP